MAALIPSPLRPAGRAFTLLEMCIVLFILAILAGAALPSINSALAEQALRSEARDISLLVRAGMLRSGEEGRAFVLVLHPRQAELLPAEKPGRDEPAADLPDPVSLDRSARVLLPDPEKPHAWRALSEASWSFQPNELCPVPRLRLERGHAWMEIGFNPLTGNVEDESLDAP
jgi:prepilin-type N-terminal cleavage/methylation domain-containing protein